MADGADHPTSERATALGPWRRLGLGAGAVICLVTAGTAAWKLAPRAEEEYRKVFAYESASAVLSRCEGPTEAADERGRVVWFPAWAEYEFVVGQRVFTGRYEAVAPRVHAPGFEIELAGAADVGREITVYYDPRDPSRNTPVPVAGAELAFLTLLLFPVAAWGLWLAAKCLATPPPARVPWGLAAYSALSVAGAAGVKLAAPHLPWERVWFLAAGLAGAVVPLSAILVGGILRGQAPRGRSVAEGRRSEAPSQDAGSKAKAPPAPTLAGMWTMAGVLIAGGLAIAAGSAYAAGRSAWRQWDAQQRLATARGTVLSSTVEEVQVEGENGASAVRYRPLVRFLYKVGPTEHTAAGFPPASGDLTTASAASAAANQYLRGRPIVVYYDLAEPGAGRLGPELPLVRPQRLLWAPLAVATGLLLACAGAALPLGVWRVRRFLRRPVEVPWRIPTMGVLREGEGGLELLRRRNPLPAAWLGYAAVAGVTFLAAGWREARTGEAMSLTAIAYGVVSCLCAAAACGLIAGQRTRLRLVLDEDNRLLTAGAARRHFTIPFDRVAAWTVTWKEGSQAAGRRRPRREGTPVLGIRSTDGQEAAIHLFTGAALWKDRLAAARKTAEEFAGVTGSAVDAADDEEDDRGTTEEMQVLARETPAEEEGDAAAV